MPTVLIVDDDKAFRKQLHTLFELGSGFETCLEAKKGIEAQKKAKRLILSLVILNSSLPDMSGPELALKLRAITPELPIFMLATDYGVNVEKKALSCGITAVFSKLADLDTLVANARAVCGIE
jgi:DNA-binding NarL/FixJ family response regulator